MALNNLKHRGKAHLSNLYDELYCLILTAQSLIVVSNFFILPPTKQNGAIRLFSMCKQ